MNTIRLRLALDNDEFAALLRLAEQELRGPVEEVRFILRQELERLGLLPDREVVRAASSAVPWVETDRDCAADDKHAS